MMINGTGLLESPALRRMRPASPLYGSDGSLLNGTRRTGKSSDGPAVAVPARSLPTDATGLARTGEEVGRALERLASNQAARSLEQAYAAAGRAARHEDTTALSGMAAYMQSGNPAVAQAGTSRTDFAGPWAQTPSTQSGETSVGSVRAEADRTGQREDATRGLAGNNSGGTEARSAERSFAGSLSQSADRSGGESGADAKAAGQDAGDEAEAASGLSELTGEEQAEVEALKKRDKEVRAHEQAHISAAGGLAAGGASFQREKGPDGNMYAVAGEVNIDTSEGSSPEATIAKAQRIKSAALAPAQPSAQDRQVAAQAGQMEAAARQEKAKPDEEDAVEAGDAAGERSGESRASGVDAPEKTGTGERSGASLHDIRLSRRAGMAYERAAGERRRGHGGNVLSVAV